MKIAASQLRQIIKEEIELAKLRRAVRNEVRNLLEVAKPEVVAKNGKIQVTIGNDMFDFSHDALKPLLGKKMVYVKDESYDEESEDGCELRNEAGQIRLTVHKSGKPVMNDNLDIEEFKTAIAELEV